MADRSFLPRLDNIVEAIEHIHAELKDVPLEAFETDWRKRWLVERDDLPPLERVCRAELMAGLAREQDGDDT